MSGRQLRHYVPLSAPSTREYAAGNESDFRLSLGFTPGWFRSHLGIDFSERWHKDPVYRYETLVQMRTLLHGMFPNLPQFRPRYNKMGMEANCATLSGVYGSCPILAVYGLPIRFYADKWPATTGYFTKEQLVKLKPIAMEDSPFVQELLAQMDTIEAQYGEIDGYLGYQGILNNAFRLMGQEIFIEMLDDPPFAEFLFEHISETMLSFIKLVQERQRQSGSNVDFLSVSNCVINMISPALYEEQLLPFDRKLANAFETFGIHTCNWDVTGYIQPFQQLRPLGYLDMGMMSDMKKARETFPEARLAVLYHPKLLLEKTTEEIRRDFQKICAEAAPVDLALVDIEANVPDERVQEIVSMAYELECMHSRS